MYMMPIIGLQEFLQLSDAKQKKYKLHTILVPKEMFNLASAKLWLKMHGYKYGKHRMTANYYRFNQNPQIEDAEFYTTTLPNGIEIVSQHI
jgi:hypothetical protein